MKKKIITLLAIIIGLPLIGVLLDACNIFDNEGITYYEIKNICTEIFHVKEQENSWRGDIWNNIDTLKYNDCYLRIQLFDSTESCAFVNPFMKSCFATDFKRMPEGNIENITITCDTTYNELYSKNQVLNNIFSKVKSYGEVENIDDYVLLKSNCDDAYGFFIKSDFPPMDTITTIFTVSYELSTGKIVNAIFPEITLIP
jgi:hypothetical protein